MEIGKIDQSGLLPGQVKSQVGYSQDDFQELRGQISKLRSDLKEDFVQDQEKQESAIKQLVSALEARLDTKAPSSMPTAAKLEWLKQELAKRSKQEQLDVLKSLDDKLGGDTISNEVKKNFSERVLLEIKSDIQNNPDKANEILAMQEALGTISLPNNKNPLDFVLGITRNDSNGVKPKKLMA